MTHALAVTAMVAVAALNADPPKPAVKWEYKVVRTDQLLPKDSDKPRSDEDAAIALNKLGQEGWELVGVAPGTEPQPTPGGMPSGISRLNKDGTVTHESHQDIAKRSWDVASKGKDRIDLNAADNSAVKERLQRQGFSLPGDGILTSEKYQGMYRERLAKAAASVQAQIAASGPTYYFKRPIP